MSTATKLHFHGLVYLAGPYRAASQWENLKHVRRAEEVAAKLWVDGWAVICPHLNSDRFHGPKLDDERILQGELLMLSRCDALYVMGGWEASEGTKGEIALAKELGLEVIYEEYQ